VSTEHFADLQPSGDYADDDADADDDDADDERGLHEPMSCQFFAT